MRWLLAGVLAVLAATSDCAATQQQAFSPSDGLAAAKYAAAAYCNPFKLMTWSCSVCDRVPGILTVLPVLHASDSDFTSGYVTFNPLTRDLVVAFRGTNGVPLNQPPLKLAESLLNWITNLQAEQDDYDAQNAPGAKVHRGFSRSYGSVRAQVLTSVNALLKLGARRVLVVGHSLGGALATLAAADLAQHFGLEKLGSVALFTFGSPRVGNDEFAVYVNELLQQPGKAESWRVVNGTDAVPQIPPALMHYHHVGQEVLYDGPSHYRQCNGAGEDPACLVLGIDINHHLWYLGIPISGWCVALDPSPDPLQPGGGDVQGVCNIVRGGPVCAGQGVPDGGKHCNARGTDSYDRCYDCASGASPDGRAYNRAWWGNHCDNGAPANCDKRGVDTYGRCYDCRNGPSRNGVQYTNRVCWGHQCQNEAPVDCTGKGVDTYGRCYDCRGGSSRDGRQYGRVCWGHQCQNEAPLNCDKRGVDTYGRCYGCRGGVNLDGRNYTRLFWGHQCDQLAPVNCDKRGVDTYGRCYDCRGGMNLDGRSYNRLFWGHQCDQQAPVDCDYRGVDTYGRCYDCVARRNTIRDFWGHHCENACPARCDKRGCDTYGRCYDCVAGHYTTRDFWGNHCENACPANCDPRGCDTYGRCYKVVTAKSSSAGPRKTVALSQHTAALAGVVAVAAAVAVLVVVGVVLRRRRPGRGAVVVAPEVQGVPSLPYAELVE